LFLLLQLVLLLLQLILQRQLVAEELLRPHDTLSLAAIRACKHLQLLP
jgi:hypothetical protein